MSPRRRHAEEAALDVLQTLRAQGHVALFAGGCVRDRLLGLQPKDFDVVTNAVPKRVGEIFPRARRVGAKFGVMLVRRFGHDVEVATFRADGPYSDGRHPDSIEFGNDVLDARRRDFTINGLFLDPIDGRIIDHVGGRADLEARILRTIGDANQRFEEDHLRMLRAIRFAARLGFTLEAGTAAAIRNHAPRLLPISPERIWTELELILSHPTRAVGWRLLVETGLRSHLCPAWPPPVGSDEVVVARLDAVPGDVGSPALPLAIALHEYDVKTVADVCLALRLSNKLSGAVGWLLASLPPVRLADQLDLAGLKMLMADESWSHLLELLRVDLMAAGGDLSTHDHLKARAEAIPADRIAPPPLLAGDRLVEMGMTPGPRMGELLDAVYREQLNERVRTRADAEALAHRLMAERPV